jgi:uncharacterized protein DUF6463
LPGNGRLLEIMALAHTVVGLAVYRRELAAIRRDGMVAGVPFRGPKSTAFWFLVPSPLVWISGRLLTRAEAASDSNAIRAAHRVGLVSASVAVVCMPVSGFWGWLAISVRGLWQLRGATK